MEKHFSFIALIALTLCLTGCGDNETASELDGYWEGKVAQDFWSYRGYSGTTYQNVDIEFYKNPYEFAAGTGVEYDYDDTNYYYTISYFDFYVKNGYIYLDYTSGQDVVIQDYHLGGNTFSGTFCKWIRDTSIDAWNVGSALASFQFVKVSDLRYRRDSNWRTRSGEPKEWKYIENPFK